MHVLAPLLLPLAALLPAALGHGYVESPPARKPGDAMVAACGPGVTDNVRQDNTSHVEGLPELAAQAGAAYHADACNLWLCKGLQFDDNAGAVQTYAAGQEVPFRVFVRIPHDGSANVSVVQTASDTILGDALMLWPQGYTNEQQFYAGSLPKNQTDFTVVMPDVKEQCSEPGACVLQWWWYGKGAKQTYESCVDFVMKE